VVILVQIEKRWMAPYVGAVVFDVKRQIAEQRDIPLIGNISEVASTGEKIRIAKTNDNALVRGGFSARVERVPRLVRFAWSKAMKFTYAPATELLAAKSWYSFDSEKARNARRNNPACSADRRISDSRRRKAGTLRKSFDER